MNSFNITNCHNQTIVSKILSLSRQSDFNFKQNNFQNNNTTSLTLQILTTNVLNDFDINFRSYEKKLIS